MIFCCQDVFLALPVLMFTYKKLQLTASALTEREQARVGEIMSFPERKRGRKRARKRERKQNQALHTASLDAALSPWQMTSKVLVQAAPAPTQPEPPPSIGSISRRGARGKAGKAPVRQIWGHSHPRTPNLSPPSPFVVAEKSKEVKPECARSSPLPPALEPRRIAEPSSLLQPRHSDQLCPLLSPV